MLQLFIEDTQAVLESDAELEIEVTSPIWDSNVSGAFVYEFKLSVEQNMHIFGCAGEVTGDSLYSVDGRKARFVANGLPMYSGIVKLNDTVRVENGMVGISFMSNKREWDDLIKGMNCRDVDISDDEIQIGRALDKITVRSELYRYFTGLTSINLNGFVEGFGNEDFELPLSNKEFLIIKDGNTDYGNISVPYNLGAKFCNVRLCWQKQNAVNSGGSITHEKSRGYSVAEYNDPGSAPSFYVLYFLDKLFSQLGDDHSGIVIRRNDLAEIEDFNRLAFLNTNPCFEVKYPEQPFHFAIAHPKVIRVDPLTDAVRNEIRQRGYNADACFRMYNFGLRDQNKNILIFYKGDGIPQINEEENLLYLNELRKYIPDFSIDKIEGSDWDYHADNNNHPMLRTFHFYASPGTAYATSENFPDASVSDVIEALQNGFGMRLLFDSSNDEVDLVLLRNIFLDDEIQDIPCTVHSIEKEENSKRGFRLKYSAGDDAENEAKAKDSLEYYNGDAGRTSYNYHDFTNVAMYDYPTIRDSARIYEKRTFYNRRTSNAYAVKVDKDATSVSTLYPSLFQVAQFNAAEYGDCSDADAVTEISIGFSPVMLNDVGEKGHPTYAVFLDADVYDAEVVNSTDNGFSRASFFYNDGVYTDVSMQFRVDYSFQSRHNYDRSSSEENPIYKQNLGITLGIMRGPGSDGGIVIVKQDYDGNGNDEWAQTAGNYAFHYDTVDDYGNVWDYNGSESGTGVDTSEQFSLCLQAQKPNPAYDPNNPSETVTLPNGLVVPNTPFFPVDTPSVAKRGIFDRWYAEYAYWITHARTAHIKCSMELAEVININLSKRVRMAGLIGFINKINYSINNDGLGEVKIELLYL